MGSAQEALPQPGRQEAFNFFGRSLQRLTCYACLPPRRNVESRCLASRIDLVRRRRVLLARTFLPKGTDDSMTTPPGASLLAARSCPSVPPYQAGHRDSDRLAASQQLLCSSKNAPRSKRRTEPGTETVLRCVRLPRHLFVRCPFLVRCSSLRSNNGGSPIRPLCSHRKLIRIGL